MSQPELITQSEYARRRGCANSAVARAVSEGRIALIDGKVDPVAADAQWAANTKARADSKSAAERGAMAAVGTHADAPVPPPEPTQGYTHFRTRREMAEMMRAELEVQKLAGQLVDRARVEAAVFDAFRALRDRVMAAPRRSAPAVIGLTEVRDVELAIHDELRRAFESFESHTMEALRARIAT